MNVSRVVLGSLSAFLCHSAFTGTMGPIAPEWSPVMTISLGPVWNDNGDTQTFYLTPEIEKTYTANNRTNALFNGEFFYGWQHQINAKFQGQVGITASGTSDARISGEIWDDADPEFNNYVYSYKINHAYVGIKGKLLADVNYMVLPYLSGSLGAGFNRAHRFINTPIIFEAVTNPNFSAHTRTSFSYTIGAGLEKAITPNLHAGIGYELADWGQSRLSRAYGQTLGTGLSQSHTYTNGLMFSLSYLG